MIGNGRGHSIDQRWHICMEFDLADVKKLLIYRMGSLGDTVVALPVFHMLARQFADAERRVMTNLPVNTDAAAIQVILGDGGFVDGYFAYPHATRDIGALNRLRKSIRDWAPDLAVYLNEPRGNFTQFRDVLFLKLCGIPKILGVPATADLQNHRPRGEYGLWENEASRLARCVEDLGEVDLVSPASWSLNFTSAEEEQAKAALADWDGRNGFIAFSLGAKIEFKSWGDDRWTELLKRVSANHPDLGLALLGGPNDGERSLVAAMDWTGPKIDLCGKLSPRESALVMRDADIFMGHDSGPMHLAASVGTPAVCVFSKHAKPGIWFPYGSQHRVLYPGLEWSGGNPVSMREAPGETNITLIPVDEVEAAFNSLLK
ncbi:MAG: glycosyl transferase [Rhodospirillaceae bacterium]|nr:glycosyl transferase [Rhodospirillaceae bacterium]|tara:strand:- start:16522 stop:17643 length:1122 start_codon:yes stop_codon:yes gene_type:complete